MSTKLQTDGRVEADDMGTVMGGEAGAGNADSLPLTLKYEARELESVLN